MPLTIAADPLVESLAKTQGKAEIVGGKIQHIMSTGGKPSYAALKIAASLLLHCDTLDEGIAFGDNAGFLCDLPNRKSFSPDAAFYVGPPLEMGFLPIPPVFAVEVRSENDYGRAADVAIAAKIADYFAAGTRCVWDVDLVNEEVRKFTPENPTEPEVFRRGERADAGDTVPNWSIVVDSLWPPTR